MTPLLIAMLVAGGGALAMMTDVFGSDDDADATEEEQNDTPEEAEPEPDLGASVVELEDGRIQVELGEDETGSLMAVVEETYNNGGNSAGGYDYQMTLYLVPEGTELPETRQDLPEGPTTDVNGAPFEINEYEDWELEDFTRYYNLTALGNWDLGGFSSSSSNSQDGTGANGYYSDRTEIEFVSESEISGLIMSYDSGAFINNGSFKFQEDLSFLDGTQAVLGTSEADVLTPTDDVSFVGGRGGDNFIEVSEAVIKGGSGDDTIVGTDSYLIDGQAGDDVVIANGNSKAWGGDGNDTVIAINTQDGHEINGDQGDDTLIALDATTMSGDHIANAIYEAGEASSDTFMVWDRDIAEGAAEETFLARITDFYSAKDQLVILTRDGEEPVSIVKEGGLLNLTYANGATGQIAIGDIDPATVTFRDMDEVLDDYPLDVLLPFQST